MLHRKRLIILGAGGFGREVLAWANDIPIQYREWSIFGFLDDNPKALKGFSCQAPIIDSIQDYQPQKNDIFAMAIAAPKIKLELGQDYLARGAQFANIIHPTAQVVETCSFGTGCVICPHALISSDAQLGDFITLNCHATIAHDVELGDGCAVMGHVDITGQVKAGRGVFFGSKATVIPGVQIGDFAIIGAGSIVVRQVKKNTTVFGNPAKVITA